MRPAGDRLAHGPVRAGVAQMMVGAHHHACRAAGGDHRAGIGERQWPAASRTAHACRPWRRRASGRGAARWWSRCRPRRCRRASSASSEARRRVGMPLSRHRPCAGRVAAHHGDDLAARRADGADHPFPGDVARADQSPADGHAVSSRRAVAPHALRSDAPRIPAPPAACRRYRTGIAGSSPCDDAEQALRRARAHLPRFGVDGGQRRRVVLGLGDIVEADDGQVDARLRGRACASARVAPIATMSL